LDGTCRITISISDFHRDSKWKKGPYFHLKVEISSDGN
jgi:hypothetical protein